MQMHSSLKVSQVKDVLDRWNFGSVRQRLLEKGEYTIEQIDQAQEEYKRFVALCAEYASSERPIIMSAPIDPFWHNHILFTRDYRAMGEAIGTGYLNHEPASPNELAKLEPDYNRTLELYRLNFGEPNKQFWPEFAQICGGSGCSCSGGGNK